MQETFALIVLAIMGLWMLIFPQSVWKIGESWKSKNVLQPSEAYLIIVRVAGVVMIITGILVRFAGL